MRFMSSPGRGQDILGRKDIINTPACNRAFGHIRLGGCLKLLRDLLQAVEEMTTRSAVMA